MEDTCVAFSYDNPIVDILTAEDVEPDWVVPNIIASGSMIILAGEPGTGKSYMSYTMSLAIAAGVSALSGLIPAGDCRRVVYFDEENGDQDRHKYLKRSFLGLGGVEALGYDNLLDNFLPVAFHLGGDDWIDRCAEFVEFWQPHLLVFDTATPCFNIQDENANAEATQAMKGIRHLMRMTDPVASALVLKHAKVRVDGGRRMLRGAKAWQSGADGVLFQVKAAGRPRNDTLSLTRLISDKVRAYGLPQTVYITPEWTDAKRNGLKLHASYTPDKEHKKAERKEDEDEED